MDTLNNKEAIQATLTSLKLYLEGEGQGLPLRLRNNIVKAIDKLSKSLAE